MRILSIFLIIGLFTCRNFNSKGNKLKAQDKAKSENVQYDHQADTCENSIQILKIINKTVSTSKIDFIDTTQFIALFKENNDYTEDCYFPNDSEYSLIYQFTDLLVKMSSHDEFAIYLLAILQTYNTTNAEYSEYFLELYPEIAEDNMPLFISALKMMNPRIRKNVIETLGNISDKSIVEKLYSNLDNIKNPDLQGIINELRVFLLDDQNFDF